MSNQALIDELLTSINMHKKLDSHTAHIEIHGNEVIGKNLVHGLVIDSNEKEDGVDVDLRVEPGTKIKNTVHLCFGMIPETGIQKITMNVVIGDHAEVNFLAHCTFPNAVDIQHLMDANISVGKYAVYTYFERHVHGGEGGVNVVPKAKIYLDEGARFSTEFEIIKGRVGIIDIDYSAECEANSTVEMNARISGKKDDKIKIREAAHLNGPKSRGILTSHIALQNTAEAEVFNEIRANAPYSRGHVDCKEIVQNEASARAIPVVEVNNPKAHVTHEAAIGSVDSKQLQTLMSRGLTEEQAVQMIIDGLLT